MHPTLAGLLPLRQVAHLSQIRWRLSIRFTPFTVNRISQIELGHLLRAISIHTNVLEGVLDLTAREIYSLINNGFTSLSSTRRPDESYEYTQQVLKLPLSLFGTELVREMLNSMMPLFVSCTKFSACMASQRAVYLGRGRYKFISNHVFSRNVAYHVFCQPEPVAAEMKKLFEICEFGSHSTRCLLTFDDVFFEIQNYLKKYRTDA